MSPKQFGMLCWDEQRFLHAAWNRRIDKLNAQLSGKGNKGGAGKGVVSSVDDLRETVRRAKTYGPSS